MIPLNTSTTSPVAVELSAKKEKVQAMSIQQLKLKRVFKYILENLNDPKTFLDVKVQLNGKVPNFDQIQEDLQQRSFNDIIYLIVEIYNATLFKGTPNRKKRVRDEDHELDSPPTKRTAKESANDSNEEDSQIDSTEAVEELSPSKGARLNSESDEIELSTPQKKNRHHFTIQTDYKFDDSLFKVILATHNNHIKPRLKLNAQERGAKGLGDKTNSEQIYFFYRYDPQEIFAVASGFSNKVVKPLVNYKFPKKAICLLDCDRIIEIAQKSLIEPYTETILRNPSGYEFYTTQQLFQFVDYFTCQSKSNASIMELPFFQAPSSQPYVTIKQSLLRFERDLDIKFYPQLLNSLSQVSLDKTKETLDPLFELLSIPQVTRENGFVKKMLINIYNNSQNKERQTICFQPPYSVRKEFLYAESQTIQIGSSKKTVYKCPALEDIVAAIFELKAPLTSQEFIRVFEAGSIQFKTYSYTFLECLNGEIFYQGRSYFKVENRWYYLKADHHALLQEDFKKFLSKSLMSDEERKRILPYSWAGNTAQNLLNTKSIQEHLNIGEKEAGELINVLKNSKVSYLQFFKVHYKKLQGEILQSKLNNNNLIKKHQKKINELLSHEPPLSETDWKRELGTDAEAVLKELERSRTIVDANLNIVNPFPELVKDEPFLNDCYDKFKEFVIKNIGKKITEKDLKKHLEKTDGEGIRSFLAALKSTSFSYIQRTKVHRSILRGKILREPIIKQHQETIELLLSSDECPDQQVFETAFGEEAAKIIEQLTQKRSIVSGKNNFVINPFVYDVKDLKINSDALQEFLEKACEQSQKSESEEEYNRSYLQKSFNEETQLFNLNPLRLVLDQVCPQGVELADVIFHDLIHDPSRTFLCVIKEEFGQDTRVACSQAITAAKMLKSALSLHQVNNYLEQLWERGINPGSKAKNKIFRDRLQMLLNQIGKEHFLQLFSKKIVFVYAFLKKGKSLKEDQEHATRVEIKDFNSFGEDSRKIYDALKQQGFLDSLGRLSGKFYGSSAERFKNEMAQIKECKLDEVYKILLKFKSISKSTLAKLELLKAAKEIESLGFEFKVSEIEKKIGDGESVDDSSEYTDTPELEFSSSSGSSSSSDISSSQKDYPYLIYRKKYKICPTVGDGGCGLHALLGTLQNGFFTCDIGRYRREFAEGLKHKLQGLDLTKQPANNNPSWKLWNTYKDIFRALLRDSVKLGENGKIKDRNAKALFESCETIKADWETHLKNVQKKQDEIIKKRDHRYNLFEKHFESLYPKDKELKTSSKIMTILKGSDPCYKDDTAEEFKDKMYNDKMLLRNAFEATLNEVCGALNIFTKPPITKCTDEIKKLEQDREKLLQDFILLPNVIEHYYSVISKNSYFLSENELVLAALFFDKHLWIITRESYPKENEPYTFAYNNNGQKPVVIYHDGSHEMLHYERCMPITPVQASPSSASSSYTLVPSLSTPN